MIRGLFLLSLLLSPTISYAYVQITEIMYDLEGSDSKREWVEIYNGGSESIDLSDWRFNDGSNHTLVGEDLTIGSGAFALLVSDIETYGKKEGVIDTVMSLANTTDTLLLLDGEGNEIERVTYNSEMGAAGNGNSLQLIAGSWIEATPTPLAPNEQIEQEQEIIQVGEVSTTTTESRATGAPHREQKIRAYGGSDKVAVASSLVFFEGKGYGLENTLLSNARYVWNFGDGHTKEGQNVTHTYTHPSTYTATLTVASGEYSDTDSIQVFVNEVDVAIVFADRGKIEIENRSTVDLDVSYWRLKYKNAYFTFPKNTLIGAHMKALFPSSATHLLVDELGQLPLLYPNGLVAHSFLRQPQQEQIETNVAMEKPIEYVYVYEKATDVFEENVEEMPEEVVTPDLSLATTTIALSNTADSKDSLKWVVALISLIAVASLVVLSSPRFHEGRGSKKQKQPKADDFTILE